MMMTLNELLIVSKASPKLMAHMRYFDSLCDELCVLTDQENDNFMTESVMAGATLSYKKVALLESFERKSHAIFALIKEEAPENMALQNYLLDKIENLQAKLRVNTSLQLYVMAQQKQAGREGDKICH